MENKYLLPEEKALATEINFAIKKYDLLKNNSNDLKRLMAEDKSWIIDPVLMPSIEMKLRTSIDATPKNEKNASYLRDLRERVKMQKEVSMSSALPFNLPNSSPESLAQIKAAAYPAIAKNFNYCLRDSQSKYESFIALEKLSELRPYLEKMEPYMNHMKATYIPTKPNYQPQRLEFALPFLYQIQQAKEQNIPEPVIEQAIAHLNEGQIHSVNQFQYDIQELNKNGLDHFKENGSFEQVISDLPKDIRAAIEETIQNVSGQKGYLPLTAEQVSILSKAKNPELVKEAGDIMANGYVSNEVASAIVDNVNAITNARDDVNIHHLTQTLSFVSQAVKMTPSEMKVLGDIILNNNTKLDFPEIRTAANTAKTLNKEKSWSPPKGKSPIIKPNMGFDR